MNCPKCQKPREKNDTECSVCGVIYVKAGKALLKKQQQAMRSSSEQPTTLLQRGGILIAIIFAVILMIRVAFVVETQPRAKTTIHTPPEIQTPTQRQGRWAHSVAKGLVKRSLKSPSTAKFSKPKQSKLSENVWQVSGKVDSQNSFGATLRSTWYIETIADPECNDYSRYSCWSIQVGPLISSQ